VTDELSLGSDPAIYEEAFRGSTDAIVITDPDGRIVQANPAWLALYGYTMDEVRGQTTRLIQSEHSDRAMYEHMWARIGDRETGSWTGEIVNRRKDGSEVPVLLSITPLRGGAGADGPIEGYMGVGIDITERKEFEEFQRLYEMTVRHDLKSPLAAIQSLLQMMAEGYLGPLPDKHRHVIERSLRNAADMRALIDTSLDLEKLRRRTIKLAIEDVDLFAIARESQERLGAQAADKNVAFALRTAVSAATDADRLVRPLDPLHLQRAVDNLVKNAVEASPKGEVVVVTIREDRGAAVLSVHNGGDPIPPDVRATLFHAFSTFGKRGGTGLGIYGVKLTVETMGGAVAYETGEGGTTFTLTFPG
jgi:PAS domain S-box-containing protein